MSDNNVQSNQFRDSLSNYAPDTKKSPSEKEKKNVTAFLPKLFILVLCGAVFAYCIYALIDIQKSNSESDSLYENIYNEFADLLSSAYTQQSIILPGKSNALPSSPSTPSQGGNFNTIIQKPTSQKFHQALSKLESLKVQNQDTAGYITVTGTGINYPVVQCADNDYYLTHSFDRNLHKSGAIFYDWRCNDSPEDNRNLIAYGHNMQNGSMFNQLKKIIANESLFKDGKIIIYAFDGIYTYDIFSVYYVDAYENYLKFTFRSDDEFVEWCNERRELSLFDYDVKFTPASKLISLSTCINGTSSGRIAVHGVLIDVER